jgi:hypothetical protein
MALSWPYNDAQRRRLMHIVDAYSAGQWRNDQAADVTVDLYGSDGRHQRAASGGVPDRRVKAGT